MWVDVRVTRCKTITLKVPTQASSANLPENSYRTTRITDQLE